MIAFQRAIQMGAIRKEMNEVMKKLMMLVMVCMGWCALADATVDAQLDLARTLFSDEVLYSGRLLMSDPVYEDFLKQVSKADVCTPQLARFLSDRVLTYDVWALTNAQIQVKDSDRCQLWEDRARMVYSIIFELPKRYKDAEFCRRFASTLATVKKIKIPKELEGFGFRSLIQLDDGSLSEEERRQRAEHAKRVAEKRARKQAILFEIWSLNRACECYRWWIKSACGQMLDGLSMELEDVEFCGLTNDVLRLSAVDELEWREIVERVKSGGKPRKPIKTGEKEGVSP